MAIYWYERAVNHENGYSAKNLGIIYEKGNGVDQSFEKAEELYLLAHKHGNDHAITNLVGLYLLKNQPDQARMWHNRALENNYIVALSNNDEIMKEINRQKELKTTFTSFINEEMSDYLKDINK
jgi:TPR repeat protein